MTPRSSAGVAVTPTGPTGASWTDRVLGRPIRNTEITTISGSVSGVAATFAKQPIQRIKWIKQVHTVSGEAVSYTSIIRDTISKQGVRGFFSGSLAAIYRNVPHSTLSYSLFPHMERAVLAHGLGDGHTKSFWTRFWAGYGTLVVATCFTHPLDTLRVRLSVHSEAALAGAVPTAIQMLREEGVACFYKGLSATMAGAGPKGAMSFGVFETLKPGCEQVAWLRDNPSLSRFCCGYLAGVASEALVYPFNTVRRRQQAHGEKTAVGRAGVLGGLRMIVATEGLLSLYRGVSLNLLPKPLAVGVSFMINDAVKDALGYS